MNPLKFSRSTPRGTQSRNGMDKPLFSSSANTQGFNDSPSHVVLSSVRGKKRKSPPSPCRGDSEAQHRILECVSGQKKRRKLEESSAWKDTAFECFFPQRPFLFAEALKRFYHQSKLPQEGAFYKYCANSFVSGLCLFLRLLRSTECPKDFALTKRYCFACTVLAMDQIESVSPDIARLSDKAYTEEQVNATKALLRNILGLDRLEPDCTQTSDAEDALFFSIVEPRIETCSVWQSLSSFLCSLPKSDVALRFVTQYLYFELVIHAQEAHLPHSATPSDLVAQIVLYALNHIKRLDFLDTAFSFSDFHSCFVASMPSYSESEVATLKTFIQESLCRSQLAAHLETQNTQDMAVAYRSVVNAIWSGNHDFICDPLPHKDLFRCMATLRYPHLAADPKNLNSTTANVLHHLGMTVVPDHHNNAVLYFNPESRNYWKEASKSPCNHLESMTKMGKYYLDREQYETAFMYISEAAKANYSDALTEMAAMYRKGHGPLEANDAKAVECYKKAIEIDDDGFAHVSLGYMYERGYGVKRDMKKAFHHYHIAASKNQEYGAAKVGLFYQRGYDFLPQDWRMSLSWFQRAQEQNYAHAETHIQDLWETIHSMTVLGNV